MNRQKIVAIFALIGIIGVLWGLPQLLLNKPTAGIVVPQGAAQQQLAWTTFEAYDNYTGGNLKTFSGMTNITMINLTNSTFYVSPADHRLVGKDRVYLLRYVRFGNISDSSAMFNVTLSYSYSSNGGNFTNITSSSFAAGNIDKSIDLTLTAGKAPLVFTGNSMVRLDMNVSRNTTVNMEIFGSQ